MALTDRALSLLAHTYLWHRREEAKRIPDTKAWAFHRRQADKAMSRARRIHYRWMEERNRARGMVSNRGLY